jgi:hypothetical protein
VIVPGGAPVKAAGKAGIQKSDAGKPARTEETTKTNPPAPRDEARKAEVKS